ncbi:MAG: C45 family autoproteolytic acyltransferase/hydrolase [Gemmataceae bacterium]
MSRFRLVSISLILLGLAPSFVRAAEPFRYPEGTHGKGSLKYVNGIPVLTVEGTPEEIGEQMGTLAGKPAAKLLTYPKEVLKIFGVSLTWPLLVKEANAMVPNFPKDYLKEMDAITKATGGDRDLLVVGNTMFDIKKLFACSTLIVEPERSATKGPLFGRNLDFPTCGFLHEYTAVEIYRPKGKHAFASVGFPGMLGVLSGINDAGLSLAVLEVYSTADDSVRFDPQGTPYAMCFRRLLEECTTVEEAEKALRAMKRTTLLNLAVCDTKHGAVFELTPKHVQVRAAEKAICAGTNHFRTKELSTGKVCWRYNILEKCQEEKTIGLDDIAKKLDEVNQGRLTLQTMIFEPATLKLHLAFGKLPSSKLPMKELDLKPLLKPDEEKSAK